MFQNFSAPSENIIGDERLKQLRTQMAQHAIDFYLIPHRDEYNNEYLPDCAKRLEWLSGFSGSAGHAIISQQQAYIFVDGRYTLQAQDQIDHDYWNILSLKPQAIQNWLRDNLQPNQTLGFDPWVHGICDIQAYKKLAQNSKANLLACPHNLVDAIWHDRPQPPKGQVQPHDLAYAGRTTTEKLAELHKTMGEQGAEFCLITDPTSICWLYNIRGEDVAHTPLVLANTLLQKGKMPRLFIDLEKLNIKTRAFLTQVCDLHPIEELPTLLAQLCHKATLMLDPQQTSFALFDIAQKADATLIEAQDPVALPRAIKNETEINGSRQAHLRDGAAMCHFLAWLDAQPLGTLDEMTVAKKLESTRAAMAGSMPLKEISFDTISGAGPHGAIVHYRVTEKSNRPLNNGELYLCDSGAQYQDGTTDITRTIAIGDIGAEEKRTFTLVLKGHIAMTLARFPEGTRGVDLDVLARNALWQAGFDYAHGTGHGVGSYLSVHEGPQSLSRHSMQPLKAGMILSNEPGYYRTGAFGIRIENLLLVTPAQAIEGGDMPMLGFETLTLAPIDTRLIETSLLNTTEREWLNAYHARICTALTPLVDDTTAQWLQKVTRPISV